MEDGIESRGKFHYPAKTYNLKRNIFGEGPAVLRILSDSDSDSVDLSVVFNSL